MWFGWFVNPLVDMDMIIMMFCVLLYVPRIYTCENTSDRYMERSECFS